jgi:allantoin racemase
LTNGARMGPLYRALVQSYGLGERLAGVATLSLTPQQMVGAPQDAQEAVLEAARTLIERDGAEAVLLAGAAMASMAEALQPRLPVPLLDGVGCAVALAQALVGLRLPRAQVGSVAPTGGRTVRGVSPALTALFARPA